MTTIDIVYKIEELTMESLEEYDCPICNELMYNKEIYQCNEGHFACKSCWIRQLKNKKECFECRNYIQSFESLSRLRLLEKQLANKDISCPYKQTQELLLFEPHCVEIIKIGDLDSHIKNCDYRLVECQNEYCFATFRFNSIHDCQYEKINCERCQEKIIKKSIGKEHDDECSEVEIKCDKCYLFIKRGILESHQENDCLESIILCKYSQYGCIEQFKRKDLEKHSIDPIHIKLLFNYIETTNKYLMDGKKYQNKWIISKYSNLYENKKIGESLISPIFNFGNYIFNIKIYPKGKEKASKNFFTIFLYSLNKCEVLVKFSFKIKEIFGESTNKFISNGNRGYRKFCSQEECKKSLTDDSLTIEFQLELLNDTVEPLLS